MSSFPLASVAAPDLSADAEMIDGRRTYLVRARIPFAFSATLSDARVENRAKAKKADTTEQPDSPTNPGDQKVVTKAKGEEDTTDPMSAGGEQTDDPMSGGMTEPVLYGIASSTGVDTYGTEMSKRALDGMAAQFSTGEVCYLPAHPSWSGGGGEWDSVIGYVTKGEVVSGAVERAADGSEPGFVLRVEVTLDPTCEKTSLLCKRIEQKRKIGQSIGGWFTELRYVYGKDAGEWDPPERVIIEVVELDHLAATRRPSNGDSWIDGMRSAISTAHDLAVTRAKAKPRAPAKRALDATAADACRAACDACAVACEAACRVCTDTCMAAMSLPMDERIAACEAACAACASACSAACSACEAACIAACSGLSATVLLACGKACADCFSTCMTACEACRVACMAACKAGDSEACRAACDTCAVACAESCRVCADACVAAIGSDTSTEAAMSDDRKNSVPLDTENAPRQDSPDDAGSEGHRASPGATEDGTPPPTPTEEPQMTEAELRAALEGSLKAALAPIAARLDAVEARTAVAPPPGERAAAVLPEPKADDESAEVKALRARLAAVEQRTAASYFGRKGHAGAGTFDRAVVEAVAEQTLPTAPALSAVVRSKGFVERRDVDHYGADAAQISAMRAHLESDLSALLNSAVDDGVVREPDAEIGTWG